MEDSFASKQKRLKNTKLKIQLANCYIESSVQHIPSRQWNANASEDGSSRKISSHVATVPAGYIRQHIFATCKLFAKSQSNLWRSHITDCESEWFRHDFPLKQIYLLYIEIVLFQKGNKAEKTKKKRTQYIQFILLNKLFIRNEKKKALWIPTRNWKKFELSTLVIGCMKKIEQMPENDWSVWHWPLSQ